VFEINEFWGAKQIIYGNFNKRVLNLPTRLACSDGGHIFQSSLGAISDLTG